MDLTSSTRHERTAQVAGLAVRLLLLAIAVPVTYSAWFLPFLAHVGAFGALDPWTSFLNDGGNRVAFPYGPAYIFAFGPLSWMGGLLSPRLAALGLGLSVLALDILLYGVLRRLAGEKGAVVVTWGYWLSPIVVYICYWHGQLDVLPVLVLATSLLLLRDLRIEAAGFALGLAAAAKLSMALAIPFVWLYAISTRRLRGVAPKMIAATMAGALTLLPFVVSPGFRRMVLDTPEAAKVFALAIPYGEGLHFYVMPLAFAALLTAAWRIRRFNFVTIFNLIGVGFFVLFLLTPASPGWAMWLMPFVTLYLARAGFTAWALALAFSGLFVLFHLATSSGAALPDGAPALAPLADTERTTNLLLSAYLAVGGAIAFHMFQSGIVRNAFYRATRAPLLIGIAGDSGAGKDTLAESLIGLFGKSSTAFVSGDDYHLWDRHKPMWRALTHLNPRANNLRRFSEDALALVHQKSVQAPHYDHHVGRMTKPRVSRPGDVAIAAGLHALHPPELLAAYDLKIFLAMDEDLRRFFKLRRDVVVRGHAPETVVASMAKREADSNRYIRPQAEHADVVLSLVPLDRRDIADPFGRASDVRMALAVEPTGDVDLQPLVRAFVAVAGLDVLQRTGGIVVQGNPAPGDIAAAARALVPDMLEYLALRPVWAGGVTGMMQLVVMDQLARRIHKLRKVQ